MTRKVVDEFIVPKCTGKAFTVKKGQVIGLCGNSGNSSQPHLHYHLQNTPIIQDASGIKCRFEKVAVTENGKGQTKREYSPVKGDIISSK